LKSDYVYSPQGYKHNLTIVLCHNEYHTFKVCFFHKLLRHELPIFGQSSGRLNQPQTNLTIWWQ